MNELLPTLSDKSFLEGSKEILARRFAYYMLTDGEQSLEFRKMIKSLPVTYQRFINDPNALATEIQFDLTEILGRYFQTVNVDCRAEITDGEKATILIYAEVVDNNDQEHSLGNVVYYDPEGLGRVIEVNNYGSGLKYLKGT